MSPPSPHEGAGVCAAAAGGALSGRTGFGVRFFRRHTAGGPQRRTSFIILYSKKRLRKKRPAGGEDPKSKNHKIFFENGLTMKNEFGMIAKRLEGGPGREQPRGRKGP